MKIDQEDLVADGNLGLAKAARKYDPSHGVPFPAFAHHYVRGAITDTVRRLVRRHDLGDGVYADVHAFSDLTQPAYDPPDPGPTPDEAVENRDRLRALATIPERERIALIRTVIDGNTAADVAEELGISANRVYTLVHDGSARVRKRAA
jgi:RNA polymerase sigma factor (sigma-70 family)